MDAKEFETRMREMLPGVSSFAMRSWISYAQELDGYDTCSDGVFYDEDFFDEAYIEFSLVKKHEGADIARKLFEAAESFTLNTSEIRGAARFLKRGVEADEIYGKAIKGLCNQTMEDQQESYDAMKTFERMHFGQNGPVAEQAEPEPDADADQEQENQTQSEVGQDIATLIEKLFTEYAVSEDFEWDCAALKNDYEYQGLPIPDDTAVRDEVLKAEKEAIRFRLECEASGHKFVDHSDGENGSGTVECGQCGYSWSYQW